MRKLFKSLWRDESGNFGIFGAMSTTALLGVSALAMETNALYGNQASLQSALDAATLAAASGDEANYNRVGLEVFDLALGLDNVQNKSVQITREGDFLVGVAEGNIETYFGGILSPSNIDVRAVTRVGFSREVGGESQTETGSACIITLSNNNGLTVQGGDLNAPNCEVHVHGKVNYNGGNIDTKNLCIAGNNFGNNNAGLSSSEYETNCDVEQDPYVDRAFETSGGPCDYFNFNLDNVSSTTFEPGTYCSGLNVNGDTDIHFEPGVYYIKQGGWNINGGNWTGEGVTFVFEGGNIQFNSNFGGAVMSAPTEGDFEGMFMVDVRNTHQYQLNSGNRLDIAGAIYMPERRFVYNSGSQTNTGTNIGGKFNFVVEDMHINGGSSLNIEPGEFTPGTPVSESGSGNGQGVSDGDGSNTTRVASSEGVPYLVR